MSVQIVEELAARFGLEVDEQAFNKVEAAIHGLHHGLKGLVGFFGAAVVTLGAIVESVGEAGDHAARAAEKIGITTQALQGLEYAAYLADVSSDSLQSGLKFLGKNAAEAAHGSTEMQEEFKRAGIVIHDTHGKIKPITVLLGELADKFHKMPQGAEKTDLALKLVGRGGIDMVPLLNKGSKAIGELTKRAEELGLVMDKETIKDSEEYADGIKEVGSALTGLKNAIGGPLLKDAAKVTHFLTEWIVKHRQAIATPIVKFAKALGAAISFLASGAKAASATWFVFTAALTAKVIPALLATTTGFLEMATAAIASASITAGAWLAAMLPLLAVGALIVLITDDLYQFATGGGSLLGDMIGWFNKVDPDDNKLIKAIKKVGAALTDLGKEHALKDLVTGLSELNFEVDRAFANLAARFGKWFANAMVEGIKTNLRGLSQLFGVNLGGWDSGQLGPEGKPYQSPEGRANMAAGGAIHSAAIFGSRPSVAARDAQMAAGGGSNGGGNVYITNHTTVDARGIENGESVKLVIETTVNDVLTKHMRAARAALQGT